MRISNAEIKIFYGGGKKPKVGAVDIMLISPIWNKPRTPRTLNGTRLSTAQKNALQNPRSKAGSVLNIAKEKTY